MKDKLEIGMYVRTNEGFIARLIDIKQETFVHSITNRPVVSYHFDNQIWDSRLTDGYYDDHELMDYELNDLVVKPSFDILDMIKKGDLVELTSEYCKDEIYRVTSSGDGVIMLDCLGDGYMTCDMVGDIKRVLTKERFAANVYEVKDDKTN